MRKELKLLVSALKSHCTALNCVFSLVGTVLAAKKISSRMFSSFEKAYSLREVNPWSLGGSFMVQKMAISSPIPVF